MHVTRSAQMFFHGLRHQPNIRKRSVHSCFLGILLCGVVYLTQHIYSLNVIKYVNVN